MIKVIASDMDGTLLCDDHRIAPDTIAAVKEACAAGIRFMVATGRGYEGAMAELDGTGIVCDYILGSGAEVRDPQRKIVKECGIGMELCREICEEVKEFPISIVFLTNEGDYRIGTEKEVEESIIAEMQLFHVNMTREEVVKTSEYRRAIESVKVVSDFEEIEKAGIPVFKLFMFSHDLELVRRVTKHLEKNPELKRNDAMNQKDDEFLKRQEYLNVKLWQHLQDEKKNFEDSYKRSELNSQIALSNYDDLPF